MKTPTTQSYLLVVDFEVGGFYYKGCVVFSFFQLVEQIYERPVNIFSKTTWNQTFHLFWNAQRNPRPISNVQLFKSDVVFAMDHLYTSP